ncbi:hypothetical protein D4764_0188520 [Takifugu flavidus]|uniref:Uncharacterized protein n=1 Tax=Takifugu flavidus TaxID=433684 RepID=A0A5C6MG52_9TELE|nr:hypothetical protein D4764_0188520 [Takifugu flavidus]
MKRRRRRKVRVKRGVSWEVMKEKRRRRRRRRKQRWSRRQFCAPKLQNPKLLRKRQLEVENRKSMKRRVELRTKTQEVETKIGSPKSGSPKAGSPKSESPKAGSPKSESPKAGSPKSESPKAGSPKSESPKAESPKAGPPKSESPKAGSPKSESPKAESPKAGPPKSESPKPDPQNPNPPKPDPPKPKKVGGSEVETKAEAPKGAEKETSGSAEETVALKDVSMNGEVSTRTPEGQDKEPDLITNGVDESPVKDDGGQKVVITKTVETITTGDDGSKLITKSVTVTETVKEAEEIQDLQETLVSSKKTEKHTTQSITQVADGN